MATTSSTRATLARRPPSAEAGRYSGWERDSGNVWKARTDIPDFRQLYVNGVRAVRARGGRLPGAELYGRDGYKTSDVNMATWGNQSDIEFIYDLEWEQDHRQGPPYRERGFQRGGHHAPTLLHARAAKRRRAPHLSHVYRERARAPGRAGRMVPRSGPAQVVYYIPRAGEDMNAAEIMAPVVEKLLELKGSLDAPVHNIQFEGLTFCQASWLRPSQIGLVDLQANFVISPQNLIARMGGV